MEALYVPSLVLAGLLAPACVYLALLALGARRAPGPSPSRPTLRFDVVVPAHNEERDIATTVKGLLAIEYPSHLFRVVVIADNCDDDTATRAREAGAEVLVRNEPSARGKGYALEYAFEVLLAESDADAFVVIDADSTPSGNLLSAFAARLEQGEHALQAEYGVRNVDVSWRTRLMTIALAMFHGVRSSARDRLRLSVGLRGNGMCFSRSILATHPHRAYGLVEDVEYGITLGVAGIRVAFVPDVFVASEMAATSDAAASQRRRWEGGRLQLVRERALPLVRDGLRRRSLLLLDLAADLLVPPLGYLGLTVGAGLSYEGVLSYLAGDYTSGFFVWSFLAACLALYVARGVAWSGLGARGVVALLWAPVYVIWKIAHVRPWRADRTWIRTRRMSEGAT